MTAKQNLGAFDFIMNGTNTEENTTLISGIAYYFLRAFYRLVRKGELVTCGGIRTFRRAGIYFKRESGHYGL